MRRGDLASAVLPGAYGSKPRPVLVIQSDIYFQLESVTVLPLTTEIHDLRICRVTIEPSVGNGLAERSQIMIDKAHTLQRHKVGFVFGRVADSGMSEVDRALALFLGFS